ncbi:pentapeptide repeat-containing protein [Streptomyces griseiscabiei]|uniref:Pentapeptide repeat-containing protein n=1 Tax=Streptomyces griseiscabiei TaxID=2993540 RepID=A0ABU4L7R3_9ACTN|nr:pentapeptide repeat-containing protein [Streptomyces griseiscabiei]MBZ3906189.1 pentapeptide repeat-containing protein [Streptomyces griseiscabiei]MDX2911184.1 pentapeptide repeat-containing protein [Streptomyces griseiscabiei]
MRADVSEVCQSAAERLAGPDIDAHRAALRELEVLAQEHPAQRRPVADVVCRYLRGAVGRCGGSSVGLGAEAAAASPTAAADAAAALLANLARRRPVTDEAPTIDLDIDLTGAVLPDVDFSGCRFGRVRCADAHFRGAGVFDGARFAGEALFERAVFEGDACFTGVRFGDTAVFGRTRFRAGADFTGARFQGTAWFGRGEEALPEDEAAWEEVETWRPVAWDERGEDDPLWPLAVLEEDYQSWEEGGDGARFSGRVSFADVRFERAAWFWKARFGGAALFQRAVFGGRVHLVQPTVDLTGARLSGTTHAEEQVWPLGWTSAAPEAEKASHRHLIPDESVAPYHRHLADADPEVRLTGLRILGELGDTDPRFRQRVVDHVCAYLRTPPAFDVTSDVFALTPSQFGEARTRRDAQRLLADRTRPAADRPFWEDIRLRLSGATLVDFDASGCRLAHGDFTGTQFHGRTSFAGASFGEVSFSLPHTREGRASFHGPADFSGARLSHWMLRHCVFHTDDSVRATGAAQDLVRMLLGARGTSAPADVTTGFRKALLTAGSETPDNLACVEHLEYGTVPGPPYAPERERAGLRIAGTDILVSDVAARIEDSPVPPSVAEHFPELTPERWSAATRVITLLLGALEAD